MKFYLVCGSTKIEDSDGQWATRDDAEQAAKDAGVLAQAILRHEPSDVLWALAKAIIERYEGGKG